VAQAKHVLPELKKQILTDLAGTLGCQSSSRRKLRQSTDDAVLLGYHSVEGSDVIDGEKGSCSESTEPNSDNCVPVIGHLAAFIKHGASTDEVLAAKNLILHSIQDDMTSNNFSNLTQRIAFVGEHRNTPQQPNTYSRGSGPPEPINPTRLILVIVLFAVALIVVTALLLKRKQNKCVDDSDFDTKKEDMPPSNLGQTAHVSLSDHNCPAVEVSFLREYVYRDDSSTGTDSTPSTDEITHSDEGVHPDEVASKEPNTALEDDHDKNGNMIEHEDPAPLQENGGVNSVLIKSSSDPSLHSLGSIV